MGVYGCPGNPSLKPEESLRASTRSLLPSTTLPSAFEASRGSTVIVTSDEILNSLLTFSITNNFAGLGQKDSKSLLERMARPLKFPDSPSNMSEDGRPLRALAENLFRLGIEADDAEVVKAVLTARVPTCDAAGGVFHVEGHEYNALQCAANLGHMSVLHVLLQHDYDISCNVPHTSEMQALLDETLDSVANVGLYGRRCDRKHWTSCSNRSYVEIKPQNSYTYAYVGDVLSVLIGAGARMSPTTLESPAANCERDPISEDIAKTYILARLHLEHHTWDNTWVMRYLIAYMDEATTRDIVRKLLLAGFHWREKSIRGPCDCWRHSSTAKCLLNHCHSDLDVAVQLGKAEIAMLLLSYGAKISIDTVHMAVRYGQKRVLLLLQTVGELARFDDHSLEFLRLAIRFGHKAVAMTLLDLCVGTCKFTEAESIQVRGSGRQRTILGCAKAN